MNFKEKYNKYKIWVIIGILMFTTLVFGVMAFVQNEKDFQKMLKDRGCVETGREYGRTRTVTMYTDGGYHTGTVEDPDRITYKCADGKTITR